VLALVRELEEVVVAAVLEFDALGGDECSGTLSLTDEPVLAAGSKISSGRDCTGARCFSSLRLEKGEPSPVSTEHDHHLAITNSPF
jgi:hypothetical protein